MQHQICPRCKFRLTSAKAICNTCGYALSSVRKEPAPVSNAVANTVAKPMYSSSSVAKPVYNNNSSNAANANLRKTQAAQGNNGGGNFWRSFFGFDPMPVDKKDNDPALGET